MFIFNQQLMIISLPLQNTYCNLNHVLSLYLTEPYSHFHILKIMFSICSIMFWQKQTNFIWSEIACLILHKQHIMLCDLGDFLKVILCSVCCSSVTLIPLWSLRFILGPAPTLGTTAPQYRDTIMCDAGSLRLDILWQLWKFSNNYAILDRNKTKSKSKTEEDCIRFRANWHKVAKIIQR